MTDTEILKWILKHRAVILPHYTDKGEIWARDAGCDCCSEPLHPPAEMHNRLKELIHP